MADAKVVIAIEVDKKTGAIKVAGQEVKGLGKKAKQAGADARTGAGGFKAMSAALGPLLAAGAIVGFFKNATDAAIQQEDAINRLNTALKISGNFSAQTSRDLQEYASSLQAVTRFGDETIIEQQALLISFGLIGDELKLATEAALDLATAQKIDLRAAMLLVGKAAVGETGSLSRYGIIIKKGIPEGEKFAEVLRVINAQFGGAAQKDVKTFGGGLQQLKNTFGDVMEQVGFQLIPTLQKLNNQFAEALPFISKVFAAVTGLVRVVLTSFGLVFEGVKGFVDSVIEIVINGNKIVFNLLRGNFSQAATDAVDLKNKLKENLLNFVEDARVANEDLISITLDTKDRILGIKAEQAEVEVLTEQEKAAQLAILEQKKREQEKKDAAEKKKVAEKKAEDERKKNKERVADFKAAGSFITNSALFEGKKQGAAAKGITSAQALIDTYGAANAAFRAMAGIPFIGPALGAAAAAIAIAAGLANVAKIQSAQAFQFGGVARGLGGTDTVDAKITPGERVLTKRQNQTFEDLLESVKKEGGAVGGTIINNQFGDINFFGVDPRTPEGRTEIIEAFSEAMDEASPEAIRASRLSADLSENNSDQAA